MGVHEGSEAPAGGAPAGVTVANKDLVAEINAIKEKQEVLQATQLQMLQEIRNIAQRLPPPGSSSG